MKIVKHSLQFVTELDETNPTAQQLLAMPEPMQVMFLESMLKEFLTPAITPVLEKINEGGQWAILKVAE